MKANLGIILVSVLFLSLWTEAFAGKASLPEEKSSMSYSVILYSNKAEAVSWQPTRLTLDTIPGGLHLEWQASALDPGIVTSYEIVRATDYSGTYKRIGIVGKGICNYDDLSINPEEVYFYKVRAIAGDRYSSFSNVVIGNAPPN